MNEPQECSNCCSRNCCGHRVFSFLFISELTQIVADVAQDPTLPRTTQHPCPKWVYPCNLYDLTLAWNSHLPYMVCWFFLDVITRKQYSFSLSRGKLKWVFACVTSSYLKPMSFPLCCHFYGPVMYVHVLQSCVRVCVCVCLSVCQQVYACVHT